MDIAYDKLLAIGLYRECTLPKMKRQKLNEWRGTKMGNTEANFHIPRKPTPPPKPSPGPDEPEGPPLDPDNDPCDPQRAPVPDYEPRTDEDTQPRRAPRFGWGGYSKKIITSVSA